MSTITERLLERHRVDSERMWPAPSDLDLLAAEHIKWMEEALQEIAQHKRGTEMTHAEYSACYDEGERDEMICIARAALQPKEPK